MLLRLIILSLNLSSSQIFSSNMHAMILQKPSSAFPILIGAGQAAQQLNVLTSEGCPVSYPKGLFYIKWKGMLENQTFYTPWDECGTGRIFYCLQIFIILYHSCRS